MIFFPFYKKLEDSHCIDTYPCYLLQMTQQISNFFDTLLAYLRINHPMHFHATEKVFKVFIKKSHASHTPPTYLINHHLGSLRISAYESRKHPELDDQSLIIQDADPSAATSQRTMSYIRLTSGEVSRQLTLDAKFHHRQSETSRLAVKMRNSHERFTYAYLTLFVSLALGGRFEEKTR